MTELVFEPFQKIGRLRRDCTITEKVDGTNAQLVFDAEGNMLVGSRKRQIWPEGYPDKGKGCDNFGFAGWAYENQRALFDFLGEGRHYGEWAGLGIQRGYGLDHKRFFLFNVARFGPGRQVIPEDLTAIGLGVVPTLYIGPFTTDSVDMVMQDLRGRSQVNAWHQPEGIIIYHHATKGYFKVTYNHDEGKWNETNG